MMMVMVVVVAVVVVVVVVVVMLTMRIMMEWHIQHFRTSVMVIIIRHERELIINLI